MRNAFMTKFQQMLYENNDAVAAQVTQQQRTNTSTLVDWVTLKHFELLEVAHPKLNYPFTYQGLQNIQNLTPGIF